MQDYKQQFKNKKLQSWDWGFWGGVWDIQNFWQNVEQN